MFSPHPHTISDNRFGNYLKNENWTGKVAASGDPHGFLPQHNSRTDKGLRNLVGLPASQSRRGTMLADNHCIGKNVGTIADLSK